MNVVVADSGAASLLADQPRASAASTFALTHAVLIPSYNTGARLFDTSALFPPRGWRHVAWQIPARQSAADVHVRTAIRRTGSPPAAACGAAVQIMAPLIEMIWAEM
jgi:hypothetical protein